MINRYILNSIGALKAMSCTMNCSNEATQLMVLFKITTDHSNSFNKITGTQSKAANTIVKTPKAIIMLKKGMMIKLVTKNNPGN